MAACTLPKAVSERTRLCLTLRDLGGTSNSLRDLERRAFALEAVAKAAHEYVMKGGGGRAARIQVLAKALADAGYDVGQETVTTTSARDEHADHEEETLTEAERDASVEWVWKPGVGCVRATSTEGDTCEAGKRVSSPTTTKGAK